MVKTYRTADLAETLAALLGTDGLDPDEALAFRFTGTGTRTGTGTGEREAASFDSLGAAPAPPRRGRALHRELRVRRRDGDDQ